MARPAYSLWAIAALVMAHPALGQQTAAAAPTAPEESVFLTHYGAIEWGYLTEGDGRLRAGEFRDIYCFEGRIGDPIVLELSSDDFDPYLAIVSPSGKVLRNDDYGGSSTAKLRLQLRETGQYRIVVTSFRPGEQGIYQLRVEDQRTRIAD